MNLTKLLVLVLAINYTHAWYSEEEKPIKDKNKDYNESDTKPRYLKYKKHYKKYKDKKYRDRDDNFDSRDDGDTDTSHEYERENYWDDYLRNDEDTKDRCNCTCTPTDCRVTAWSKWSEPRGLKGTRERKRHVLVQPTNNGEPCPRLREARATGVAPTIDQTAKSFYKNFILHKSVASNDEAQYDEEVHKKKSVVPRDLLFILDESGSIGRSQFRKVRAGVARLIELICGARLHQSKVSKEVLLVTDGKSNCGHDIVKEAEKLRTIATVYTVGIGEFNNKYAKAELETVVSAPKYNHAFNVPDERGFLEMLHRVETRLNETWVEYGDACATIEWDK
ncbi:unnamed protein product [Owenia fusiformis]|uniref:Uncharacterized protein n=1 Tax=Owenia fusiformis TaxID=6347 RepID=A0A8J1TRA4_OWEFU|nr:unnamed protein product [Owenia fusiformis]